jgi:hypothetical protein
MKRDKKGIKAISFGSLFERLSKKLFPPKIVYLRLQFIPFMQAKDLFNSSSRHFLEILIWGC